MTTIYLIRHSLQLRNIDIDNDKIILSVLGEEKAKELSDNLELNNIDVVYSSNYVRAISTAKYIAFNNNIDINIDERFGERKLGDLDRLKELGKRMKYSFTEEQLLDEKLKNDGGENLIEVDKRMSDGIRDILNNYIDKNIVIVTHGAAIKFYLKKYCSFINNKLIYNDRVLDFSSPSIIKISFDKYNVIDIKNIF